MSDASVFVAGVFILFFLGTVFANVGVSYVGTAACSGIENPLFTSTEQQEQIVTAGTGDVFESGKFQIPAVNNLNLIATDPIVSGFVPLLKLQTIPIGETQDGVKITPLSALDHSITEKELQDELEDIQINTPFGFLINALGGIASLATGLSGSVTFVFNIIQVLFGSCLTLVLGGLNWILAPIAAMVIYTGIKVIR